MKKKTMLDLLLQYNYLMDIELSKTKLNTFNLNNVPKQNNSTRHFK